MINVPRPAFRRFVRVNSSPVTVHRRDDTTSGNYGNDYTYTELSNPRDLLVTNIDEVRRTTEAGEYQFTSLVAYAVPDTDVQVNDRIEHGGQMYEIANAAGRPNEANPAIYRYELDDV